MGALQQLLLLQWVVGMLCPRCSLPTLLLLSWQLTRVRTAGECLLLAWLRLLVG